MIAKNRHLFIAALVVLTCFSYTQAHILIFTYAYNRTDFIEIQYKTLKKFMLDDAGLCPSCDDDDIDEEAPDFQPTQGDDT